MPEIVFEVIAPLFGIILAGYVCGRIGLMGEGAGATLNQFVFAVSFPALILVSLSNTAPDQFFDWPFIGSLTGGMLVMFIVGAVVSRAFFRESLTATAVHSLSVMFSSTGYIGLPLAEYERSEEKGIAILRPLGRSLQNPLLIATAAGLAVSASGWSLPPAVAAFGELLGGQPDWMNPFLDPGSMDLGRVDKAHPVVDGGEVDEAKKIFGGFVVAGREAPEVLQKADHPLDTIAQSVAAAVQEARPPRRPRRPARDRRDRMRQRSLTVLLVRHIKQPGKWASRTDDSRKIV